MMFLRRNAPERQADWNTVVLESPNFLVVPTLGMLVPGWLLIISKGHYINMGALPKRHYGELETIAADVRQLLTKRFGPPIFFEHGPVTSQEPVGCCIDHAHVHAVPLSLDLLPELASRFPCERVEGFLDLRSIYHQGVPYLFYEDAGGERYAFKVDDVPSQFMRRLIAEKLKIPDKWDWAVDPGLENIEATLVRLKEGRGPSRDL